MLPPGIGFNAVSPRALEASKTATLPRAFWSWDEIIAMNADGYWPTTPNTNLLYGLHEALEMLLGEGLDHVFARHQRWAEGVRAAVDAWQLPIQCVEAERRSPVLTGVIMPAGVDADAVRRLIYERFDLSLGTGLGKVKGRMFRIGHLGDSNDLTLLGTLAGCEMGLEARRRDPGGERRAGGDGAFRAPHGGGMSLPNFIHESLDDILAEWERECGDTPRGAEPAVRKLHFGKVLKAVAEEMRRIRATEPATAPGPLVAPPQASAPTAAPHSHASQLVDDYASLRASVVRQWRRKHPAPSPADLDDLVHFNEAMDRSLAELAATFSPSPSRSQPQELFLGVLNHELRTSVASILMSAQVLTHRSTPGSPEAKAAQRILRSCQQLRQTLDALSDLTKVRLGEHLEIDRVHDDMGVLCRQALDAYARVDPERRVRLTADGDPSGDWDTARIREAVGGLLGNAARFASRGSVVTIAVDGRAADTVKVTVHGDGTPIDVEMLQTIFDPVARGESENATYAGLGLGLFIVRKVVDAHGGQVTVAASKADGTTFTVVLPRHP